jgi:hypothetical protein
VPTEILNPANQWKNKGEFDTTLSHLADLYQVRKRQWKALAAFHHHVAHAHRCWGSLSLEWNCALSVGLQLGSDMPVSMSPAPLLPLPTYGEAL